MPVTVGEIQLEIGADTKKLTKAADVLKKTGASVKAAERGLLSLKSTLGGADRAASQMQTAQKKLNDAVKAGLIGEKEQARLVKRMKEQFSTASVEARDLRVNMGRMAGAMEKLQGRFRGLGGAVQASNARMATAAKRAVSFRGATASLLGTAGIGLLVNRTLNHADALTKQADRIGISTKSLQEYGFAADLAGVSQGNLENGLSTFTKRLGELQAGKGALHSFLKTFDADLLAALTTAKDTSTALDLLFKSSRGLETAADRAALFANAFSKAAGINMTTMIDGTEAAIERARELGLVVDEYLLRRAAATNDALTTLGKTLSSQFTTAILENASAIQRLADGLTTAMPKLISFLERVGQAWGMLDQPAAKRLREITLEIRALQESITRAEKMPAHPARAAGLADAKTQVAALTAEYNKLVDKMREAQTVPPPPILAPPTTPPPAPQKAPTGRKGKPAAPKARKYTGPTGPLVLAPQQPLGIDPVAMREMTEGFKEYNRVLAEGARVYASTRTPVEAYFIQVEKLDKLLAAGAIEQNTFNRAVTDAAEKAYPTATEATKELTAAQEKQKEIQAALAAEGMRAFDSLGHGIVDAMLNAETAMQSFRNTAKMMIDDVIHSFVQLAFLNPLKNSLFNLSGTQAFPEMGSLFTEAKGGAYVNGARKLAKGGLLTGPTLFSNKSGLSIGGEAGTEAVMPLARNSRGQLGVLAASGGGGGNTRNVNNTSMRRREGDNIRVENHGGDTIQIFQTVQVATGVAPTVRAEVLNLMPLIIEQTKASLTEARARGGKFGKSFGG
jgi:hypothetical protein